MDENEEECPPEDESLFPIKEDISEWLNAILGSEFSPDSLFQDIQTGSVLCEVASALYKHVRSTAGKNAKPLPPPPAYSQKAMARSFLARDNTANFITWCRQLGVKEAYMFESESLVLQRQRRNVLLCLLDVARIFSKCKTIPTPHLIRLERAIELEEEKDKRLIKDINGSYNELDYIPATLNRQRRKEALQLDNAVHKIVDNTKFKGQVNIERTGEGRYRIFDKMVFIRMLRDKHVMVRVGGGWDSLEHYLDTHEVARPKSAYMLLSFTEVMDQGGIQHCKEKKFHQFRTRIPLRTQQS